MTRLVLLTDPTGKARPFVRNNGQAFTPAATRKAEKRIRDAWKALSVPIIPAYTPIKVRVGLHVKRPPGHLLVDGIKLSAAGRKMGAHWCLTKPDTDNAVKLVMDALEGVAYARDVDVVALVTSKSWTTGDAAVIIEVYPMEES